MLYSRTVSTQGQFRGVKLSFIHTNSLLSPSFRFTCRMFVLSVDWEDYTQSAGRGTSSKRKYICIDQEGNVWVKSSSHTGTWTAIREVAGSRIEARHCKHRNMETRNKTDNLLLMRRWFWSKVFLSFRSKAPSTNFRERLPVHSWLVRKKLLWTHLWLELQRGICWCFNARIYQWCVEKATTWQ